MKNYIIEHNSAKKFQAADKTQVAEVKATSKKAAIAAYRFYLKSGLNPVDAEVTAFNYGYYSWDCAFTAYEKI